MNALQERESFRDTWAEICLASISNNIKSIKSYIGSETKMMAVVKADGYGHGAVEVGKLALRLGVDYLAVAILDEALQLRESGIRAPILILGYTPIRSISAAVSHHITITVYTEDVLEEIITQAARLGIVAAIHLKVDTGMNRIGVTSREEALSLVDKASKSPFVRLEGIYTHFAIADEQDCPYTAEQFMRFMSYIQFIEEKGYEIPIKHCCNSAATLNFPHMHLDMVRVGIALYGLYPAPSMKKHPVVLEQAISLKSKIVSVKTVPESQSISYGCTYKPDRESLIATLPIGYADGLSRALSNVGHVAVRDRRAPIVGRICMDQTMINVTDIADCKPGEVITLIGIGGLAPSVDEMADWTGTINYEVVCLIGKRVPRVFK
ncbi:alanine racemase [Paenibacillus sp. PAMC21692]|uniref:alanine racemase n=1 Tax=Paenibacillus sp. PAMC21692 TaxID=2762320 RepID=UPI00164D27B6|nr:alanine racemase [Paenibacillus sp. PAMC21692]QNK60497.1 alanine racemase [Paenibacillus sp. PAMC21692]